MTVFTPIKAADATPVEALAPRRRPVWQRGAMLLVPVALIGAIGVRLLDQPDAAMAAPPPASVTFASPLVRQVSEWDDYVGRFAPSRSVEIRPRVAGEVTGVHFHDGDIVRKGQLLFTIDSRPFAAAHGRGARQRRERQERLVACADRPRPCAAAGRGRSRLGG
jgi:multidrug efflux system membrane fusion protein